MSKSFTQKASHVLSQSVIIASEMGHNYIGSEHILLALLYEPDSIAAKLLEARSVTPDAVREAIRKKIGFGEHSTVTPGDMTPRTKRILENAAYQAMRVGQNIIGTEHLLLALLSESDSTAVEILTEIGLSGKMLDEDIQRFLTSFGHYPESAKTADSDRRSYSGSSGNFFFRPTSEVKRSYPPPAVLHDAPTIEKYGRDLTKSAREGKIDPIIGREEETERVIRILSRRQKNNPCLIGEPGVGKTAVIEGLAVRIAGNDISLPDTLLGRLVMMLDLSAMIAGAKYRGEFEERMKNVLAEALKNPSVILFIDEIHTIVGAGAAEGAVDAANILKPALARSEIQLIGATTLGEYRAHIEKDSALERRFQPVLIEEPSPEKAVFMLKGLRHKYEEHHKVKITDSAIEAAVSLSVRYLHDRYLPDKALDLIDEAAAKCHIAAKNTETYLSSPTQTAKKKMQTLSAQKEEAIRRQNYELAAKLRDEENRLIQEENRLPDETHSSSENSLSEDCYRPSELFGNGDATVSVTENDIAAIVTSMTGIPVEQLCQEENDRLRHLEEDLSKSVIGQSEAIHAVSGAIRRGRMGLADPNRPTGSFLFAGATGVGKTALAKALAEQLFGSSEQLVRIDMSEYGESHSVSKLIGSPPGYIGFSEGGQLTEKIRRHPYCVLLLDEIEKAHPAVFDLLLQLLEDGILTDSSGRKVDFKNTIVIMTSNCGASGETVKPSGFTSAHEDENGKILSALKSAFRPEFLNRLDEIIVFHKLSDSDIEKIASMMLNEVAKRSEKLGYCLFYDDTVIRYLAKKGYDAFYGARPLRRFICREVEDALAGEILADRFHSGDRIAIRIHDDRLVFEPLSVEKATTECQTLPPV